VSTGTARTRSAMTPAAPRHHPPLPARAAPTGTPLAAPPRPPRPRPGRGAPPGLITVHIWTFLDEARDPGQIKPGALVVAGDEDTAAVREVVDLAPAGDGTIVHLRLLPGLVDYRQLVERTLAS
jgi:hypothetical protein